MTTHIEEYRLIGDVKVPPMAIGTWSWGDSTWGYDEQKDFEPIRESWHATNKVGLTFYDTAEAYGYGKSEEIIGRLIKETDKETKEKLYIATKFLPFPYPGRLFLINPPIVQSLRKSLHRLGLDSLDLYQLHSPNGLNSFKTYANGLAECYKLGLCKAVGVSNFSKDEVIRFADLLAEHDVPLASNQVQFSLLRQLSEKSGMLEEMKKRNIAVLAYSPLAMGRLTGKYSASNPIPKGRQFGSDYSWEQLEPLLDEMRSLAKKYDVSISAIALNWVICKGAIPLGGARNEKQAIENAKSTSFRLTPEEVDLLSSKGFVGSTSRFWQHG